VDRFAPASGGPVRGRCAVVVQAANGVGLVTLDDNQGFYFLPGTAAGISPPAATQPSALSLRAPKFGQVPGQHSGLGHTHRPGCG